MKALLSLIATAVAVFLVFAGINKVAEVECRAKWEDSGFAVQYGFMPGCRVQAADGKWIPADNYREVK